MSLFGQKGKPMKRFLKVLFLSLLVICSLAFITACGGDDSEDPPISDLTPPATPAKKYIITFVVDGTSTSVITEEGKVPVFEGSTDKTSDDNGYYNFKGWDKELAPASENTKYVAQYDCTPWREYSVKFVYKLENGTSAFIENTVKEGKIPTIPTFPSQCKTATKVYTHTGWSIPLEPVTEEFFNANKSNTTLIYTAEYSEEDRLYKVDFMSGNKVIYTDNVKFNAIPEYKGDEENIKIPAGYNYQTWSGIAPVTQEDMKVELIFTYSNPEELEWAYNKSLLSFSPSLTSKDSDGDVLGESNALLFLLLEVRNVPDFTYSQKYIDRAVAHLKNMVSDSGDAPHFELAARWAYAPLSASIALAKFTPVVWRELSLLEVEKYDIVMRSFAYIGALGTDDDNSYKTGPGLEGNYSKGWNPNYRLSNYTPIIFAGQYFGGADAVDNILLSFDYDTAIADFNKYPCFKRAYARWTTTPVDENGDLFINPTTKEPYPLAKDFMQNGGTAYIFATNERLDYDGIEHGGSGVGVRTAYTVQGMRIDDVGGIFSWLLNYTFDGGAVWSDSSKMGADGIFISSDVTVANGLAGTSKAYIIDGSTSPYEGMPGMMKELAGEGDGGCKIDGVPSKQVNGANIRASCSYCALDFMLVASLISAFESLRIYDCKSASNIDAYKLMWVGMSDFLYKIERGHKSYANGKQSTITEGSGNASATNGYYIWKSWWRSEHEANNPFES